MKKNLLTGFLIVGFLMVLSAVSINAQTSLADKYNYKDSITEGNPMDSSLEIKGKIAAVFTYISAEDDYETKERPKTWSYNKAKKFLTKAHKDNKNKVR